jgi:hypothetical protein
MIESISFFLIYSIFTLCFSYICLFNFETTLANFIGFIDEYKDEEDEEKEKEKEKEEKKQLINYEDKYVEKYRKMEKREVVDPEKLKNSILFENTPLGNVLMFYDSSRKSFVYYADKSISYKYLESVGMRYVVTFNCSSIFYDMQEEIKLAEEKTIENRKTKEQEKEKEKEKEKEDQPAKSSVFAKFKKYNNSSEKTVHSKTSVKIVDDTLVVKENANRYSYEGKLSNYNFLKIPKKTETLSYADFKKISHSSNE